MCPMASPVLLFQINYKQKYAWHHKLKKKKKIVFHLINIDENMSSLYHHKESPKEGIIKIIFHRQLQCWHGDVKAFRASMDIFFKRVKGFSRN